MNDSNIINGMTYAEMQECYDKNFSLGYISKKIQDKFLLISLICYLTYKAKQKSPGVTHWQIIKKLTEGLNLPERSLMGLSIMCDDFSYGCTEFPTFGIDSKEIIIKVKQIFNNILPF